MLQLQLWATIRQPRGQFHTSLALQLTVLQLRSQHITLGQFSDSSSRRLCTTVVQQQQRPLPDGHNNCSCSLVTYEALCQPLHCVGSLQGV